MYYIAIIFGGTIGSLMDLYIWIIALVCAIVFPKIKFAIPAALLGLLVKYFILDLSWHRESGILPGPQYFIGQIIAMLLAVYLCTLFTRDKKKPEVDADKDKENSA